LEKNLCDLREKYGQAVDRIVCDLCQSMNGVIHDEFIDRKLNPQSNRPVDGVNYFEDRGSISFDMGDGRSMELRPYWVAIDRQDDVPVSEVMDGKHANKEPDIDREPQFYSPRDFASAFFKSVE